MRSPIAQRRNARAPGLGPLPWRRIHGFSAQKHGAAVHAISQGVRRVGPSEGPASGRDSVPESFGGHSATICTALSHPEMLSAESPSGALFAHWRTERRRTALRQRYGEESTGPESVSDVTTWQDHV